jgi:hypothetical protein
MVLRGDMYSMKGVVRVAGRTRWLGRNLRASGLGVGSVWMKIVRCCWWELRGRGWGVGRRGRRPAEGRSREVCRLRPVAEGAAGAGRRHRMEEGRKTRVGWEVRGVRPRRSLEDVMRFELC